MKEIKYPLADELARISWAFPSTDDRRRAVEDLAKEVDRILDREHALIQACQQLVTELTQQGIVSCPGMNQACDLILEYKRENEKINLPAPVPKSSSVFSHYSSRPKTSPYTPGLLPRK